MALLMLRTHDLSWQDHVVNIEFMVNPSHNQLLLNKHKTLASKCDKVKRTFDRELKTAHKNMVVDVRMMERKRSALEKRKAEIMSGRGGREFPRSPKVRPKNNKRLNETRGQSAPPTFLTEINKSKYDISTATPSIERASPASRPKTVNALQGSTPSTSSMSQHHHPASESKSSARRKSVRFEKDVKDDDDGSTIPERIKTFVENQISFNNRPISSEKQLMRNYRPLGTGNHSHISNRSPLVAKRYDTTKLEIDILKSAFDDLCINNSLENFKKLSSLANRVKTNFKLARNTSMVPAIGTIKASRKFKETIGYESTTWA